MLGKTAGGLYWMFRYLERGENIARLLDAGVRIALTRASAAGDEWESIIATAGVRDAFTARHDTVEAGKVVDFLLRDDANPSSVLAVTMAARNNARMVRTALTSEVWEATNEAWMTLKQLLARPVAEKDLPAVMGTIRQQSALVRGALYGTMLRNDIFNFARIGTFLERADSTARILDVKYYVLLPSVALVGSSLDNVQWEMILRSVSAFRAYRWLNGAEINPVDIADFLILDQRLPRSLAFCHAQIADNLGLLAKEYGERHECHAAAEMMYGRLMSAEIDMIMDAGLHEFIEQFIADNAALGGRIETDYRFYE